jgi:hypothetical protein
MKPITRDDYFNLEAVKAGMLNGPRNPSQQSALLAILRRLDPRTGTAFPSIETIAHESRLGRNTAIRAIAKLKDGTWIGVAKRKHHQHGNEYTVDISKFPQLRALEDGRLANELKSHGGTSTRAKLKSQSERVEVPLSGKLKSHGGTGSNKGNNKGKKSTPNPLLEGALRDHALSRDPLTISGVGYVETDAGYLTHEDVEALEGTFADGNRFTDPFAFDGILFVDAFAFAEGYVPELDFDPHAYAKLTREEFVDWIILAGYQCDSYTCEAETETAIANDPKEQLDAASTARVPEVQQTKQPTTTGSRRRPGAGKPDRLRTNANSR